MQAELKEKLAKMYDVRDPQQVFCFGFRTQVQIFAVTSDLPRPLGYQVNTDIPCEQH